MKNKRFSLLAALGALLLLVGLMGLWFAPGLVQYAFVPSVSPAAAADDGAADESAKVSDPLPAFSQVRQTLADAFPLLSLHGQKTGVTLTAGAVSQNDVCLYLVTPVCNELYPRRFCAGRPISPVDVEESAKVIVLSRQTAFLFFGQEEALGRQVTLGGLTLEVVGVADHDRRPGETGETAAWVPFGLLPDADLLVFSSQSPADTRLLPLFEAAAKEAFGPGTLLSLPKERMAATMALRFVLLAVGLCLLKKWLSWLSCWNRKRFARVREQMLRSYAGKWVPCAVLILLPSALLLALSVGAGYALAVFALQPAFVFPEWIPESLGDFSTWVARFWSLTSSAANPVSLVTPELAEIRFFAAILRTGLLFLGTGLLLPRFGKSEG